MLLLITTIACVRTPSPREETVAEAPTIAPRPKSVENPGDLTAVLASALERGACRDGKARLDGIVVVDAANPAHQALLIEQLGTEPIGAAAVAAGLLWDARVALPAAHAEAVGRTLQQLHQASVEDVQILHCRKLKSVQADGILWLARGDALALLAHVEDRTAATPVLEAVTAEIPDLEDPGKAAFGDADAIHRVNKETLRQLCEGRTWKTTWMLRTLDIGKKQGSLLPLGQLSTGACELLARGMDPDVVTPRQ